MEKQRVAVGMSGGVDSSVAAMLLKQQGYEVIGITMRLGLKKHCAADKNIEDARRVARKIGIQHYIFDVSKEFEDKVIKDFCCEYLKAKTPNPCIRCNQYIKFGVLLKKALDLGLDYFATGHYARVSVGAGLAPARYILKKAKDVTKDQSYFLYRLNQSQLRRILFPLGDYTKLQVRQMAKGFGLPIADKPESQEICFVAEGHYSEFLKGCEKSGQIVDKKGRVLGRHKGIAFYTIGQRQGLGIACGVAMYVIEMDVKQNKLVVGTREDALAKEFLVKSPHFILMPIKKKVVLGVKIRYNQKVVPAEVVPFNGKLKVKFKIPQFAITPGQSAVFYDKDKVIGGGIIARIL